MMNRRIRDSRGLSVAEYILMLGIVVSTLYAMNTYVKRGVQAKYKGMTDYFIGASQDEDGSTSSTTSTSNTTETSSNTQEYLTGGGTKVFTTSRRDIEAQSTVTDTSATFLPSDSSSSSDHFTSASKGNVTTPVYSGWNATNGSNTTTAQELSQNMTLENLTSSRDALLEEADGLDNDASELRAQGDSLIARADQIDCDDDDSCEQAKRDLYTQAQEQYAQAVENEDQAESKRDDAAELDREISNLTNSSSSSGNNNSSGGD